VLCKREFYIADSNVSGKDGCVIVLDARLITQIVVVQQHPAGSRDGGGEGRCAD